MHLCERLRVDSDHKEFTTNSEFGNGKSANICIDELKTVYTGSRWETGQTTVFDSLKKYPVDSPSQETALSIAQDIWEAA